MVEVRLPRKQSGGAMMGPGNGMMMSTYIRMQMTIWWLWWQWWWSTCKIEISSLLLVLQAKRMCKTVLRGSEFLVRTIHKYQKHSYKYQTHFHHINPQKYQLFFRKNTKCFFEGVNSWREPSTNTKSDKCCILVWIVCRIKFPQKFTLGK